MKFVKTYDTKAKWSLGHIDGVPVGGYYVDGEPRLWWRTNKPKPEMYDPGVNVLIHGDLVQTGTGRGRSSAYMCVQDEGSGMDWSLSIDGIDRLMVAIAVGEVKVLYDGARPLLRGYWTFAKRGTEVSIIPAPRDLWC